MRAGYNHDLLRAGRRLHVQTEDHPRARVVVSHLFLAGRVIASRRTPHPATTPTGFPDDDPVRRLMREQHRALLRAAARGDYDDQLPSCR